MRDRLRISRTARRPVAGTHAMIAGRCRQPGLAEMMGQKLPLVCCQLRESLSNRAGNAFVPFATAGQKQTLIGGIADQRMLETKAAFRATALGKYDSRRDELHQRSLKLVSTAWDNRIEQCKRELPADNRSDLGHFARLAEAIQSGHQRVPECSRHYGIVLTHRF